MDGKNIAKKGRFKVFFYFAKGKFIFACFH